MVRRISSSRPITGIELAVARRLGQVAGIFLQRVIGVFGRGAVRGAALAQRFDRRIEVLRRDAALAENGAGLAVLLERQPEQQPLDRDKAVAGLLGGLFRGIERARQFGRKIDLPGAASRDFRQLVERVLGGFEDRAGIAAGAVDQTAGKPFAVVQQHFQHVQRRELLVAIAHGQRLRRLDEAARALGVFFNIHAFASLGLPLRPVRHDYGIFIGFPRTALTFLNRPRVVALIFRLDANVGMARAKRKRPAHKFGSGGAAARESLKKPHVDAASPARIAGIYRYPVKGLTPEQLSRAELEPGQTLLADRRYAIENGPSGFDPAEPKWLPKPHFLMLMRDEWLAGAAHPFRRCEPRPDHPPQRRRSWPRAISRPPRAAPRSRSSSPPTLPARSRARRKS